MKNLMIIMQGVQGSGKSTLAKTLKLSYDLTGSDECEIFSTDDLHMEGNKYVYKSEKAGEFHRLNQKRALDFIEKNKDWTKVCIIDNTNIRRLEAKPYVLMVVDKPDWEIQFIRCTGNFKSIHGVPQEKIDFNLTQLEHLSVKSILEG